MDKKEYYANKITKLIEQAKKENIRICVYTLGKGNEKVQDSGIIICEMGNETKVEEMIAIPL